MGPDLTSHPPFRDLNQGPLLPEGRIIPLDQVDSVIAKV